MNKKGTICFLLGATLLVGIVCLNTYAAFFSVKDYSVGMAVCSVIWFIVGWVFLSEGN